MVWFHAKGPRGLPIAHFVRSSHHEQIAFLFTPSSSFLLKQETPPFACLLGGLYPWACGPAGEWDPHPLRSTLIDVCLHKHQWCCSVPRSPLPIVRYHTIVICKGNHIKPPATRSPTQRFPSVKNLIKIPNYSFNKNSHKLENVLVPPYYQIAPSYRKVAQYPQLQYYFYTCGCDVESLKYRYMYLKTYRKFTFSIQSQGHSSAEHFLYYCMHLSSKFPMVYKTYEKKRPIFIYC